MSDLEIEGPMGCTKALLPELVALANGIFRPDGSQDIFTDCPKTRQAWDVPNNHRD